MEGGYLESPPSCTARKHFPRKDPGKRSCLLFLRTFPCPLISFPMQEILGLTGLFACFCTDRGLPLSVAAAYHVCLNQTGHVQDQPRLQPNPARAMYHQESSGRTSTKPRGLLALFLLHFAPNLGAQPGAWENSLCHRKASVCLSQLQLHWVVC